ncbi:MAG: alpha-amylase family glycosyl hydrolase [Opitutales bacterium]
MPERSLDYEAERSLKRLMPRVKVLIEQSNNSLYSTESLVESIEARLDEHWPRLFVLLYQLYGTHYDFFYYLEQILLTAVECWLNRPDDLYELDLRRENDPGWYLSEKMVGVSLYVDLYAGDLNALREHIPYLKDLGITYLHLMPLFASRAGNSDGGYAISDYRSVDPKLGSVEDLSGLASDLRRAGISLVLDFVFNHTSDDHMWALRAQEGDPEFQDYFHIFPDRTIPDQYERHLREIFPTIRRGNFTWHEGMRRWVWTSFNSFQWDLKYANPEVFRAMASEMLFLANTGVEILRLDAVAFIWKKMGTNCENLPEAHLLIQAFNTLCRIVAPGLAFKSEAIVHPDEVVKYISPDECQISYNPTLMALMWEAIATRQTKLLKHSLSHRQKLEPSTAWLNYLRSHDDIGWSFADEDAWHVGIDPHGHRNFLNSFYSGRFPGTFSKGVPFQYNEDTGDMRVCGTMASLSGLELAEKRGDPSLKKMALKRMRMMYGVLCSMDGIPMIFMGDEWGLLNDYTYLNNPEKAEDSRWVHRPKIDWSIREAILQEGSQTRLIFLEVQKLFHLRKETPAFRGNHNQLIDCDTEHTLSYRRWHDGSSVIVLANFSEKPQTIATGPINEITFSQHLKDMLSERSFHIAEAITLEPYDLLWLVED